jgi:hypothetical protein
MRGSNAVGLGNWPAPKEVVRIEVCLFAPRRIEMAKKRHKPEEIVAKLRQVDALVS